jgi:hypothetical protein
MITFHHLIILNKKPKMLNIVKSVVNAGNLLRFLGIFASLIVSSPTLTQCVAIQFSILLGNVVFRTALSSFLLLEMRNLNGKNRRDDLISVFLFLAKIFCTVPVLSKLPVKAVEDEVRVCYIPDLNSKIITYTGMLVDFVVIIFIADRLIKTLRKVYRENLERPINLEDKNKRSLYLAVVYWNFLRLFVASVAIIIGIFTQFGSNQVWSIMTRFIINIIISYVVTIDAEIVRESTKNNVKSVK